METYKKHHKFASQVNYNIILLDFFS